MRLCEVLGLCTDGYILSYLTSIGFKFDAWACSRAFRLDSYHENPRRTIRRLLTAPLSRESADRTLPNDDPGTTGNAQRPIYSLLIHCSRVYPAMRITPFLRNIPTPRLSTPSAALRERVRRPAYFNKLTSAEELAPLFKVRGLFVGEF